MGTARPALDDTDTGLRAELDAIEAKTGWRLWLSELGAIWMQSVSGITLRAATPLLALYGIACWEHAAAKRWTVAA